jgi:hypothetical protein
MTGRSGSESRQRTEQVGVRLTLGEWRAVTSRAEAAGVSVGTFMRDAALAAQEGDDRQRADHYQHLYEQASEGRCGHSGKTLADCKRTICDCFEFPWVTSQEGDAVRAVAAVEAVHTGAHWCDYEGLATWYLGNGVRADSECPTLAALADTTGALAKHDAKVLREAADRMPAFHDRDVPEWAITSACRWLRERADRIEAEATDR